MRGTGSEPLLRLDHVVDALGIAEAMGRCDEDVPLDSVIGTLARDDDYDAAFVPRRPDGRGERVARLLASGTAPPVDLVRLGELYFVHDGHRRVSAARRAGWVTIPARVTRYCTVAYAACCLRAADLTSKAAERRFLERVPLPDHVRELLWLDDPADWSRLTDHARAWMLSRDGRDAPDPHAVAAAWWDEQVVPVLEALRRDGVGAAVRDVQLYVTALAVRDRLGAVDWPRALRCCAEAEERSDR